MDSLSPYYETTRAVSEYLLFHYGTAEQILPQGGPASALHFPVRCVTECLDKTRLPPHPRALDLGCAVGRSTFELARFCDQVVGVDYSERFIGTAKQLQDLGSLDFAFTEEGELTLPATALVPSEINRQRVTFEQGDAHDLCQTLGEFDVVLMANLIDRLREPRRCLEQLPSLVKSGGQLILTSPYTWLEEFTPKENWLGGFVNKGQRVKTFDTLKEILTPQFHFSSCKDLPFLIREHARKYQWSVAEASLWIRK